MTGEWEAALCGAHLHHEDGRPDLAPLLGGVAAHGANVAQRVEGAHVPVVRAQRLEELVNHLWAIRGVAGQMVRELEVHLGSSVTRPLHTLPPRLLRG